MCFLRAELYLSMCEYEESMCACVPAGSAVTQWGFSLKCRLTGMKKNDRCEIMRADGIGNERRGGQS